MRVGEATAMTPTKTAQLVALTLVVLSSVALGAVLLGQDPSLLQLCGVALILAGLVSVAARPRRVARA